MPEDASLDAFASTGDDETDSESSAPESPDSESSDAETVEDVAPAVSTYRWSPAGGECADCGESVERRWRADGERDGALVCADCKEW